MTETKWAPIVTLDGPAGSGKSTTAKAVARRLGYRHLDSGSLYRALTFALLSSGVMEAEWDALTEKEMRALDVRVAADGDDFSVLVEGRAVTDELRSPEVTTRVALLASLPASRACLITLQREAGARGGLVADGRDMGSVVFPEAEVKIYLVAELGERAKRRLLEGGVPVPSEEQVEAQVDMIAERDRQDTEREISPLRKPEDAHLIDTTRLDFEEQVDAIVALVETAREKAARHVDGPQGHL